MPDRTTYARRMPKIYGNLQPKKQVSTAKAFGWLVYLVITVGSAALILYALFFSSLFTIKHIEVRGVRFSSLAEIQASVPLGRNIWLLSSGNVAQSIMHDPTILSAQLLRGLPGTVRITITERTPSLLWVSGNTTSLVDSEGQVFKQLPSNTVVPADIPQVHDSQSLPVYDGQALLSPSFVKFVMTTSSELAAALPSMPVAGMSVSRTTYVLDVALKDGPTLSFSALSPADVQVRNAASLILTKKIASTAHIDLRVDRWAYVR